MIFKRKHSTKEGKRCDVKNCKEPSYKTVSASLAKKTSLNLSQIDKKEKRIHLCKQHARIFKKETKKDRELDRLSRM
ncbi:MAG TPA: hypothetical protein EYP29_02875 [Thermoplasmata archaeon]|nr:hypothetical protein [Thermoplasmata archaeon]